VNQLPYRWTITNSQFSLTSVSIDDILGFLKTNLSSLGGGKIPTNVEHQFYVWQKQRDRIQVTPNCVLRTFPLVDQAERAVQLAQEMMGFVAYFPGENGFAIITTEEIEAAYAIRLKQMTLR
jgi:hypothetical protein